METSRIFCDREYLNCKNIVWIPRLEKEKVDSAPSLMIEALSILYEIAFRFSSDRIHPMSAFRQTERSAISLGAYACPKFTQA